MWQVPAMQLWKGNAGLGGLGEGWYLPIMKNTLKDPLTLLCKPQACERGLKPKYCEILIILPCCRLWKAKITLSLDFLVQQIQPSLLWEEEGKGTQSKGPAQPGPGRSPTNGEKKREWSQFQAWPGDSKDSEFLILEWCPVKPVTKMIFRQS